MDRMPSFDELRPGGRVVFGSGRLLVAAEEAGRLGQRIGLIASASAAQAAGELAAVLGAACVLRLDGVPPHVRVDAARDAVERVARARADALVSIGGGAATGLAKAVAHIHGTPIVAVPTTYAGSEMTPVWGRTEGGGKITGRDPRVLPSSVVYDPELTLGLPPEVSAGSGMNALAQALAAVVAPDRGPVAGMLALEAIRELAAALPEIAQAADDLAAREHAMYGAYLAGSALATVPTGVHHRLAHVISGRYGLPHAATHSALLPHVVGYIEKRDPDRLAPVRQVLGAPDGVGRVLYELATRIGAPTSLASLDLDGDALDAIAAEVDEALIPAAALRALLADAHAGRRPEAVLPDRGTAGEDRWLDDAEQATWRAWLDTCRLVLPALDRQLRAEGGASLTDYEVLVALSEAPQGRLRMAHVADRTVATRSAITRTVDRLVQRGWVCRAPSVDDQRGQYAELTESGWQAIRTLAPGHVRTVRGALIDMLSPADAAAVRRVGERVRQRLELDVRQNPRHEPGGADR